MTSPIPKYDDEDPSWSPPVVQEKRVGFLQRMLRAVMPSERNYINRRRKQCR